MFPLNSSLHCGSASWDTNYARTYLQISEDQLEKINKIPGWSKTEISEKITTENEKTLENIEKQLTQQASTSTENPLITKTNIFVKDNVLKTQYDSSDLLLKQKPIIPLTEKEVFLKYVSLSPIKKKYTSTSSLQRSSSLPDLYKELLSPRKSAEICREKVHSLEKDISSFKLSLLSKKDLLNETYTVPVASNGGLNHDELLQKDSHKSLSCPLEYLNQLSKQKKLKTLDDSILNQKYLKGIEKSVAVPLSSKGTVKIAFQQDMRLLGKRLLLLEKRLSPCKEMSLPTCNEKLLNVENLNPEKNLKSSPTLASAEEFVTPVPSSDSVEILDDIQNSSLCKSHKSLESQSNSQSLNEKCDAPKNTFESVKDSAGDIPKTTVCNFESFLSPPVPCGQLLATQVPSLSQPISAELNTPRKSQIAGLLVSNEYPLRTVVSSLSQPAPSQKSAELNTPRKLLIANPPVPNEQPLPKEVPSLSQPVPSQKLAKLDTPNESQDAEIIGKIMVLEKPSGTFNVFSSNSNEKVSDLASSKELGAKRKRRNRSEKSSKKLDVKKLKRTDIQFSSPQIRSMIEIMKIFHTEF